MLCCDIIASRCWSFLWHPSTSTKSNSSTCGTLRAARLLNSIRLIHYHAFRPGGRRSPADYPASQIPSFRAPHHFWNISLQTLKGHIALFVMCLRCDLYVNLGYLFLISWVIFFECNSYWLSNEFFGYLNSKHSNVSRWWLWDQEVTYKPFTFSQ